MMTIRTHLDNKPRKSGQHSVFLRLTKNRKTSYISTNIKVLKSDWNDKYRDIEGGGVKNTHTMAPTYNKHLKSLVNKAQAFCFSNENATFEQVKNHLLGIEPKKAGSNFVDFANNIIDVSDWAYGTKQAQKAKINTFSAWAGKEFMIEDFELKTFQDFSDFLSKKSKTSTVAGYLKKIIGFLNIAVIEGIMSENWKPWARYKMPKIVQAPRTYLSEEEIMKLEAFAPEHNSTTYHVKNAFLMQFYVAGERISDLLTMTWENITNDQFQPLKNLQTMEEGTRCTFQIYKSVSKKYHSVILPAQAREILVKYSADREQKKFVFPFLDSIEFNPLDSKKHTPEQGEKLHKTKNSAISIVNKYLVEISQKLGIPRISSHTARRTYAQMAKKHHGVMIEIKDALAHSDIKTTEGYFDDNNFDGVDNVQKSVHEKRKQKIQE